MLGLQALKESKRAARAPAVITKPGEPQCPLQTCGCTPVIEPSCKLLETPFTRMALVWLYNDSGCLCLAKWHRILFVLDLQELHRLKNRKCFHTFSRRHIYAAPACVYPHSEAHLLPTTHKPSCEARPALLVLSSHYPFSQSFLLLVLLFPAATRGEDIASDLCNTMLPDSLFHQFSRASRNQVSYRHKCLLTKMQTYQPKALTRLGNRSQSCQNSRCNLFQSGGSRNSTVKVCSHRQGLPVNRKALTCI